MGKIKSIKNREEYQNFLDILHWMDINQNEISAMMFVTEQMSIQEGMLKYKDK